MKNLKTAAFLAVMCALASGCTVASAVDNTTSVASSVAGGVVDVADWTADLFRD